MTENKTDRDLVPTNFSALEEFEEFWTTPSLADYDDLQSEAAFNISLTDGEVIAIPLNVEE